MVAIVSIITCGVQVVIIVIITVDVIINRCRMKVRVIGIKMTVIIKGVVIVGAGNWSIIGCSGG